MKANNPHVQNVLTLCNRFQKGLCMDEKSFVEDLKTAVKMIDIFAEVDKDVFILEPVEEKVDILCDGCGKKLGTAPKGAVDGGCCADCCSDLRAEKRQEIVQEEITR